MSSESWDSLLRRTVSPSSEAARDQKRKALKRAQERALEIPPVKDRRRRLELEAAGTEPWLRHYLGDRFYLPFSPNQSSIISEIDYRFDHGGQKAIADMRGGGKTSIVEGCTLKGIIRGKIHYPLIVAANGEAAADILTNIKSPVETNELLAEDYPELCIPIRDLSEAPQKAMKQTVNGRRTMGAWSKKTVKFPTVWMTWCPLCLCADTIGDLGGGPFLCLECGNTFEMWPAPFSGARIKCVGIFGKIRGKRDGAQRPDFALLDDIEDEQSAISKRLKTRIRGVIDRAIAGAGGPDKNLSVVLLCTIQNDTCISAEYTDREQRATYNGDRYKQVIEWPQTEDAKTLWLKYVELRQDGRRLGHDPEGKLATEHYVVNREEMDAGFTVVNKFRFRPGEISAQQHIYNQIADNGLPMVLAEYQNAPKAEQADTGIPKADALEKRRSGLKRWVVPAETQVVVSHIDVGQTVLWWTAAAYWGSFGGSFIAYGCWPHQHRSYIHASEASPTIAEAFRKAHGQDGDVDAMIFWALGQLTDELASQPLFTESGVAHNMAKIGIDSGWETETIYRFCRASKHKAILIPTKGMPLSVKKKPMGAWDKVDGETRGWNSRIVPPKGRQIRIAEFDANAWKTRLHDRLSLPLGSASAISFFGEGTDLALDHKMISAHLTAETRQFVKVGDRDGYEYEPKPGEDNHLLDTATGTLMVAGFNGISVGEVSRKQKTSRVAAARKRGL
ncbi:terminase gpA endonuclease subunit [Planctomyces sp. SH-PL14]|uniref:terminase gpA endonuclease subunit n=1 Tax=Planctomyces sp. SH-PL14 TaxID=1632864 RepID=UPI00078DEB62|nr:terminase gpA endonuclease subunit [Planctomyces sp. SH-PL14]AMV18250.1 Phage terminase large subunit (GpA) [Planctomyces sp. SH-PL14]